jgi:hypothetical protein
MTVKITEASYLSRLLFHAHNHHNVVEVVQCQTVFHCSATEWKISKEWRHTQVILRQQVSTAKLWTYISSDSKSCMQNQDVTILDLPV